MSTDYYLIDDKLEVKPLIAYLSKSGTWWDRNVIPDSIAKGAVADSEDGEALAVTPDGTLIPGKLYESSTDPRTRFYLPQYRLNVVDGRYTSKLRRRTASEDPNGPLAFFELDVSATVPSADGFTLREIPHTVIARIGYQMPISAGTPFDGYLGTWINADKNTREMTRLEITLQQDCKTAEMHGFGKCHPEDCDWGTTEARIVGDTLTGSYDFGFKTTEIIVRRSGAQLLAELRHRYAVGDWRPDRISKETLVPAGDSPAAPAESMRPVLWIEVGAFNDIGGGVKRACLAVNTKPDFDRLYQVLTDSSLNAFLEIKFFCRCRAAHLAAGSTGKCQFDR